MVIFSAVYINDTDPSFVADVPLAQVSLNMAISSCSTAMFFNVMSSKLPISHVMVTSLLNSASMVSLQRKSVFKKNSHKKTIIILLSLTKLFL